MPGGNYFRLYVFYYHGDFPLPVCVDDFGADYGYSADSYFWRVYRFGNWRIFNFGCQPCPGALVCGYVLDYSTGGREPDISPGGGQLGRAAFPVGAGSSYAGRQHLGGIGDADQRSFMLCDLLPAAAVCKPPAKTKKAGSCRGRGADAFFPKMKTRRGKVGVIRENKQEGIF